MPLADLQIVHLPPQELRPYAKNARIHTKRQLAQIEASIRTHGFTTPVLIDEDSVIISGHGRTLGAKAMGLDLIPTIRVTGLTDEQRRSLRIAENKIAANADWDMDLLRQELEALTVPELNLNLNAVGFSVGELDVLLTSVASAALDVVPAVPVEPVGRSGDIWLCGPHRIGCGDSRDRSFLSQVVGVGSVDAAFHDPPYNVNIGGHAVAKGRHREFAMASGEMTREAFTAFLFDVLAAAASVSKPGAVHFVCMDHHHVEELSDAGERAYGRRLNICVWVKSNPGMGALYRSQHELVFVYVVGEAAHFNAVELGRHGRNRTNVWNYPSVNALRGGRRHDLELHPTVKPIQMVADAICDVTRRDERVLDLFIGAGTTLLACERVGRRCVGVEIDPSYTTLSITRWRDLTGREPILEATGQTLAQVAAARREVASCA